MKNKKNRETHQKFSWHVSNNKKKIQFPINFSAKWKSILLIKIFD
jgi:hypothetical protein